MEVVFEDSAKNGTENEVSDIEEDICEPFVDSFFFVSFYL